MKKPTTETCSSTNAQSAPMLTIETSRSRPSVARAAHTASMSVTAVTVTVAIVGMPVRPEIPDSARGSWPSRDMVIATRPPAASPKAGRPVLGDGGTHPVDLGYHLQIAEPERVDEGRREAGSGFIVVELLEPPGQLP